MFSHLTHISCDLVKEMKQIPAQVSVHFLEATCNHLFP